MKTAAIILAAGQARRFGANKLVAQLASGTVLQHVVDEAEACNAISEVVVVVGGVYAAEVMEKTVIARGRFVTTDRQTGPGASLLAGLGGTDADQVVILLGDQPGVTHEAIGRVARHQPPARASYGGAPGHPVLVTRATAMTAPVRGDKGLRDILSGLQVALVEVADVAIDRDVDTPDDLADSVG